MSMLFHAFFSPFSQFIFTFARKQTTLFYYMDDDKTKDNGQQASNTPLDNASGSAPEEQSNEGSSDGDRQDNELTEDEHSDYKPADRFDASAVHHLSGMYKNWFLDYASYVILERAVPSIEDDKPDRKSVG